MELYEINPYVRYARTQISRIPYEPIIGLDHRIFYCHSGEGKLHVDDTVYSFKEGSLIFIRAGVSYFNPDKNKNPVYLACNFDFMFSRAFVSSPIAYVYTKDFKPNMLIEKKLPENLGFIPDVLYIPFVPVREIFEEIIQKYNEKELYYDEYCGMLLKNVFIQIIKLNAIGSQIKQADKADRILHYVREHFTENLSNAEIAKQFSYHPNYINKLIVKRTGLSLHKYLLQYRIQMATHYLESGSHTVTETAEVVGFSDIKHFSKAFCKITGFPPSAYIPKGQEF